MNKKSSRWIAVVALAGLLNGCGSESGAPSGSTIGVAPSPKTWEVAATEDTDPYSFIDQPVAVTVRGPNGQPINDVDITVSLDLSPGTVPPGFEVMFLFEDDNGDGVPDTGPYAGPSPPDITDMAVGALALPYRTKVNSFGTKQFVLRMAIYGGILSYRGQLNVISGAAVGIGEFEVECADGPIITCP
jgi:hypothetical protein